MSECKTALCDSRVGQFSTGAPRHRWVSFRPALTLSTVSLPRLQQAVQRAQCWRAEPNPVSSDVIALVVLWRLRYKLSRRDLPEMFLTTASDSAMRRSAIEKPGSHRCWLEICVTAVEARRAAVGIKTHIKVHGPCRYLYRAIDRSGTLVDVMFSEYRDMAAAKAFFGSARMVTGVTPDRVTTDEHDGYPRAIRTTPGEMVRHRDSQYLNNRLEQDDRGVKGRFGPMRGFKCP